jgi:hypothetical protein
MFIIIKESEASVSVDFESTFAPCKGCNYYQMPVDGDGVSKCNHEDRPLTGTLVEQCMSAGWKRT